MLVRYQAALRPDTLSMRQTQFYETVPILYYSQTLKNQAFRRGQFSEHMYPMQVRYQAALHSESLQSI